MHSAPLGVHEDDMPAQLGGRSGSELLGGNLRETLGGRPRAQLVLPTTFCSVSVNG